MTHRGFISSVLMMSLASVFGATATTSTKYPYKDANLPIETRINDLLQRMTLEEKVMQLNQYTLGFNNNVNNIGEEVVDIPAEIGSLIYYDTDPTLRNNMQRKAMEESRLGIPILFGWDVLHGFRTIYPVPLAQACSMNPALVEEASRVSARESRMSGVDWTFSPMIDVARDPRWGRVVEGFGEDPYVNGVFAAAAVRGYQGDDLTSKESIAACLKHYVGYGASEAGRDYVYTEISSQTLWDTYLLPFEMGVNAGAQTLMSSFNCVESIPCTANYYTLTDVLKKKWGHDGFVVSDWAAVETLMHQGMASDLKEAAKYAFNSGMEMDMMSHAYDNHLADLVKEGAVTETQLNEAVRRVLRLKMRLGLFENPYTPASTPEERFLTKDGRQTAKKLAAESIVLLKNDNGLLPLKGKKNIAVIGPWAEDCWPMLGSWYGHGEVSDVEHFHDAIVRRFGKDATVTYAHGCNYEGTDTTGFAHAADVAKNADVVLLCLGETIYMTGENTSRSSIALPKIQEDLAHCIHATGTPTVLLLSNGRPLELNRIEPLAQAILETWQLGTDGADVIAATLAGDINPSGKLAMTFPYSTGQIPIYYNRHKPGRLTGGHYHDITSDPLYPFGYGLSYTTFEYSDITASATNVNNGQDLWFEVEVKNTGSMDGSESVMWYVTDSHCSIMRPVKELKYFEKVSIPAGESRKVRFNVDMMRDLGFVDAKGSRFLESGEFIVSTGDKEIKITLQ